MILRLLKLLVNSLKKIYIRPFFLNKNMSLYNLKFKIYVFPDDVFNSEPGDEYRLSNGEVWMLVGLVGVRISYLKTINHKSEHPSWYTLRREN